MRCHGAFHGAFGVKNIILWHDISCHCTIIKTSKNVVVDTKTRKPLIYSGFAFGAERGTRTLYKMSKRLGVIAF